MVLELLLALMKMMTSLWFILAETGLLRIFTFLLKGHLEWQNTMKVLAVKTSDGIMCWTK